MWIKINEDYKPVEGVVVLGYNPSWVDEDYNPRGMNICFMQDGYWLVSVWCNSCDCWHTKSTDASMNPEHYKPIEPPTRYIAYPKPPTI
jgi:hypothetical protein